MAINFPVSCGVAEHITGELAVEAGLSWCWSGVQVWTQCCHETTSVSHGLYPSQYILYDIEECFDGDRRGIQFYFKILPLPPAISECSSSMYAIWLGVTAEK